MEILRIIMVSIGGLIIIGLTIALAFCQLDSEPLEKARRCVACSRVSPYMALEYNEDEGLCRKCWDNFWRIQELKVNKK